MYDRRAMEHPNEDARQHYLKNHPDADPKNHTVKKKPTWWEKTKKNIKDFAGDVDKGLEHSEVRDTLHKYNPRYGSLVLRVAARFLLG